MKPYFESACHFETTNKNGRFQRKYRSYGEALDALPQGGAIWEVKRMRVTEESVIVETIYRRRVRKNKA